MLKLYYRLHAGGRGDLPARSGFPPDNIEKLLTQRSPALLSIRS